MKISLEWTLELLAAVVLSAIILTGVRTGKLMPDMHMGLENKNTEQALSGGQREGAVKESPAVPIEKEHQIEDFEIVLQMPELPTGCEVTALTMVLNYYGFDVDKVTMAEKYLPTTPAKFYNDSNGEFCGPDLNRYFVGDPAASDGYICGTRAIQMAANRYLKRTGSSFWAAEKNGASVEEIYRLVSNDVPVIVWVTINMEERHVVEGWKTESGEYVEWGNNDHGAVLTGYTEDTVTIADPIAGKVIYNRRDFEEVYFSRGNQCVFLLKSEI